MKEIRMDEETLNLEILIQVTLTPKGEQRPPKAAMKRVGLKVDTIMLHSMTFTANFKGGNLLGNNSTWDFDDIVDTMDPYYFFPHENSSPRTSLTNIFGTRKKGAGINKILISP